MSNLNQELKPFFESALKTLECIIEHKEEISNMDPGEKPCYKKICVSDGLCTNISSAFIDDLESYFGDPRRSLFSNIMEAWASAWPKYSGQTGYPVPMPENFPLDWEEHSDDTLYMDEQTEATKAYAAFHACDDIGYNMYAGEYGQLRIELAEYWAGKLREKLNEINSET